MNAHSIVCLQSVSVKHFVRLWEKLQVSGSSSYLFFILLRLLFLLVLRLFRCRPVLRAFSQFHSSLSSLKNIEPLL